MNQTPYARQRPSERRSRVLPRGIRARLFLLIALVLLPMTFLLGWTNYQRFVSLRDSELRTELEVAQGAATTFAAYASGVREQLFTIGRALLTPEFSSDTTLTTSLLEEATAHFPAVRDLSWVSPEGTVLASSVPALIGQNLSSRSYIRDIIAGRPWMISDLLPSGNLSDDPEFFLSSGVRDHRGNLRGVVVAGIGPDEVGALTFTRDRPDAGAVAIFDRQGVLVYLHPERAFTWEERVRWRESDPLLKRALASGEAATGFMRPAALEGEWISARVPLVQTGWVAGAGRPADVAFAPLREMMFQDGSLTVLITSIAFLLAYFVSRTIARPLLRLEQDAHEMGVRQIETAEDPQAPAEVESLRNSVAAMAAGLVSAKEAAEEASRAKSEFLANMSHELRTPMTVIMGSLDFLQQRDLTGEARQLLSFADTSAHRLLGIIDDLLDISRIEAGRLKIEEIPFDVRECVRQAVEMFAPRAEAKGVRLHGEVDPHLPSEVSGDPDRLGQVLVNLVGNAVKFTERGEISVTVTSQEENLVFTVRDTGIGIPAGKIGLLFQPFTQVDSSLTRRHGGTGLGLAISRELVELMGGRIGLESEEGRGSTFTFTIPLRPAEAAGNEPRPEVAAAEIRTIRVLLAEDDPLVADLVTRILKERGLQVTLAENGRQTVAKWQEERFPLILMDLQMPEMNGLEAARRIRALEGGKEPRTCIVALTAHARQADQEECLAAGMDGFLAKPLRLEELTAFLDHCSCGAGSGQ